MRPSFPAFPHGFGVALDVDLFQAIDAFFDSFGGILVLFSQRFEERPQKRERNNLPVDALKRPFHFFLPGHGTVRNRQTYHSARSERTQNYRKGIFAQEQLSA